MMNAQKYEGETNKKGQPHGQGVITFTTADNVEKLEGFFEKGMPVSGKSMRFDKFGRLKMVFEGTFTPKKKGQFTKLADLLAYGNITFYYYEGAKIPELGYYFKKGEYRGDDSHTKYSTYSTYGVKNMSIKGLSSDILASYEYLMPMYVFDLMKENDDKLFVNLMKYQGVFEVASIADQRMENYTITDIGGEVLNNMPNGVAYGLAFKGNDKEQYYYFKGEFENGQLKRIKTLKQYNPGGKVRNCYVNYIAQKYTAFLSENDYYEYIMKLTSKRGPIEVNTINQLTDQLLFGDIRTKENIEKAKLRLANFFMNDVSGFNMTNLILLFNTCPEIANAKNVITNWEGSQKVDMNDAFLFHLRKVRDGQMINNLSSYYLVYKDWGPISEDERIDSELDFILSLHPDNNLNERYKKFFPDGRYLGKDFKEEGWALAFIEYSKRILTKNDPIIWYDLDQMYEKGVNIFDWMHYPRLSKSIGVYYEDTKISSLMKDLKKLPKNFNFNQRKLSLFQALFTSTKYVFESHRLRRNEFYNTSAFDVLKEGSLRDEAKAYRSLLDGIAAAARIVPKVYDYVGNTGQSYCFNNWFACHQIMSCLVDGLSAAKKLSSTTPEISPACKKAESFIKEKINLLEKKVFIYDDAWAEVIKKNTENYNRNKEEEEKILQEVENLGLPNYKYQDESWQKDYNDEEYREICFEDLKDASCTTIWRAKDRSYYKTVAGAFLNAKYKTETDAIIASYAYLKYGEVRQKGKIK